MHPIEFQSETLAQNRIPSNEKLIRKIDTLSTPSQGHITFNISFYIFCVWLTSVTNSRPQKKIQHWIRPFDI